MVHPLLVHLASVRLVQLRVPSWHRLIKRKPRHVTNTRGSQVLIMLRPFRVLHQLGFQFELYRTSDQQIGVAIRQEIQPY